MKRLIAILLCVALLLALCNDRTDGSSLDRKSCYYNS